MTNTSTYSGSGGISKKIYRGVLLEDVKIVQSEFKVEYLSRLKFLIDLPD